MQALSQLSYTPKNQVFINEEAKLCMNFEARASGEEINEFSVQAVDRFSAKIPSGRTTHYKFPAVQKTNHLENLVSEMASDKASKSDL